MTEPDAICHQFWWWVCSATSREGPMDYAKAKQLVAEQPNLWMEIVAA